jgi:hypothetical protein
LVALSSVWAVEEVTRDSLMSSCNLTQKCTHSYNKLVKTLQNGLKSVPRKSVSIKSVIKLQTILLVPLLSQLAKAGVGEQQLIKITGHSSAQSIRSNLQLDSAHHSEIMSFRQFKTTTNTEARKTEVNNHWHFVKRKSRTRCYLQQLYH